jgi:hypothetical protein
MLVVIRAKELTLGSRWGAVTDMSEPSAAPPQLSADGLWWWTGETWTPTELGTLASAPADEVADAFLASSPLEKTSTATQTETGVEATGRIGTVLSAQAGPRPEKNRVLCFLRDQLMLVGIAIVISSVIAGVIWVATVRSDTESAQNSDGPVTAQTYTPSPSALGVSAAYRLHGGGLPNDVYHCAAAFSDDDTVTANGLDPGSVTASGLPDSLDYPADAAYMNSCEHTTF